MAAQHGTSRLIWERLFWQTIPTYRFGQHEPTLPYDVVGLASERRLGLGQLVVVAVAAVFVSLFDVVVLQVEAVVVVVAVVVEPKVVVLVVGFDGVTMDEEFVDANVVAEELDLVVEQKQEFGGRNGANVVAPVAAAAVVEKTQG